jgi:ribonuclease D
MSYEWIARPAALADLAATLAESPRLGLDTEFMRVHTFAAELALIQVADGERVALIDPIALHELAPLAATLRAATPLKIMHSASEDLLALKPVVGDRFGGLFDTQVAAAFAGLGAGIGYQRLVRELLGIDLPKSETRSDWRRRPLSRDQLAYAVADVSHLGAVHDALVERLDRRGMRGWADDECARVTAAALDDAPPQNPHWEFKSAARWPLERQARLKRLLDWREALARRIDRPRSWILDNPALMQLIETPPDGSAALAEVTRAMKSFPKRELEPLAVLLASPLDHAQRQVEPIPAPLRGEDDKLLEALRERVAARAAALDLPAALLAPRRLLEAVVRGQRPPELEGWRGQALDGVLDEASTPT